MERDGSLSCGEGNPHPPGDETSCVYIYIYICVCARTQGTVYSGEHVPVGILEGVRVSECPCMANPEGVYECVFQALMRS